MCYEIGADKDHVHFLVQSVPTMSPTEIIKKVKSITAREVFKRNPEVRSFWTSGSEAVIREYVKNQDVKEEYEQLF